MNKLGKLVLATGFVFILAACGETTEELIHEQLEEAYKAEKTFYANQSEIAKLEEAEKQLFDQIINKDEKELAQIEKISKQAKVNINERKEKIAFEQEGMDASEKAFSKIKGEIKQLEDENLQKKANQMFDVMTKRYQLHSELNELYMKALDKEEKLYSKLSKKETKYDQIMDQLEDLNGVYDKLINKNESFNEETEKYNKLKKEFYDASTLDITYDYDESKK